MNLSGSVKDIPLVGDKYANKLAKLNIKTIEDLIYHIPSRYVDFRQVGKIGHLRANEKVTILGQLISINNVLTKSGKLLQLAKISDGENTLDVIWMNMPYLLRSLKPGHYISLSGKISFWNKKLALVFPEYEILTETKETLHTGKIVPIYPETAGVSSKWIRSRVHYVLKNLPPKDPDDPLPDNVRSMLKLPRLPEAIRQIHEPGDSSQASLARERLAFDEILEMQIAARIAKIKWKSHTNAHPVLTDRASIDKLIDNLPYKLTTSQTRSIDEILSDIAKLNPMNRLLEGDVGSGKTIVAAVAAYATYLSGYQSIIMAPTQILAEQHFRAFSDLLKKMKVKIALITGAIKKRDQDADIFIGTHALLNKAASDKTALVVIDEQHRFGVAQRAALATALPNGRIPHTLTMTATPIPRTVALSLYGDLDLSTLDQMPKGRKKIVTWIVPPQKREGGYKWLENEIHKHKVQAYVVCPLIDESEAEALTEVKAAKIEYEKLKKIYPKLNLGLLHGKIKASEKTEVLRKFNEGQIDILVSTPVIEVGIDVSNATIMVIEAAERFGLAQLHQLRGRVGRGDKQSYCLLMTESKTEKTKKRLSAMQMAKNGMELAEIDLTMRGSGHIFGTRQHGDTELKFASWSDISLIKKSREIADEIIADQGKYTKLFNHYRQKQQAAN